MTEGGGGVDNAATDGSGLSNGELGRGGLVGDPDRDDDGDCEWRTLAALVPTDADDAVIETVDDDELYPRAPAVVVVAGP